MSRSVVIIHAAEDTLPARALAEKVRQAKLDVTLERGTGEELRTAIKGAAVTIALWSPRSVGQTELVDDAAFAKGKTKLIHAVMQSAPMPEQFRNEPNVNLTGWRGEDEFPAWLQLAKQVTDKAGVAPLPPPAPKPPSGFFQPGMASGAAAPQPGQRPAQQQAPRPPQQQQRAAAPPPQQRAAQPAPRPQPAPSRATSVPEPAKEKKGGAGVMIAIIAFIVVALVGGGGYWFMTQQNAQTSAFESVDPNSASALRAFLAGNPSDADRASAQEALSALERSTLDAAREANTVEAYEAFLRDFPDSDEAIYAQGQIQQLRQAETAAPPALGPDGLPLATDTVDPDLVPPGSVTAPPATTPPPTTGGPAQLTPPPAAEPAPVEPPPADQPTN